MAIGRIIINIIDWPEDTERVDRDAEGDDSDTNEAVDGLPVECQT